MHPILFTVPGLGLAIPGFGVMVALGAWLAWRQMDVYARRLGLDRVKLDSVHMWTFAGIFLGARSLYFTIHSDELMRDGLLMAPVKFVSVWEGGLVYYGGLIGGTAIGAWRALRAGFPLLVLLDITLTSAFLAQVLGRVGCLLAGCDHGMEIKVTDPSQAPWWAIHVPDPLPAKSILPRPTPGVPMYLVPAPILMSLKALFVHLTARLVLMRQRAWGVTSCWIVISYGTLRSLIETVRGDWDARGYLQISGVPFSTSQLISIPMVLAGIAGLWLLRKRRQAEPVFAAAERAAAKTEGARVRQELAAGARR
jgi:phosphatidylglycerol:prolipoprotein diacylglycerol transferase